MTAIIGGTLRAHDGYDGSFSVGILVGTNSVGALSLPCFDEVGDCRLLPGSSLF
jgi:hypothetical protein